MRTLSALTGGLVAERDPAQPLLTLYDGPTGGRVELSGATTANWVAKSANLLVDGLGGPDRVGLLLPLHWQSVALLLATVATGATAVVADGPGQLEGCAAAFVRADQAQAALDAGVDDVLALSGSPLGAPTGALPPMVLDYAREVPSYGDAFPGPPPVAVAVEVAGRLLPPVPPLEAVRDGRLLTALPLAEAAGLVVLLGALRAGAGLVLAAGDEVDLAAVALAERVTATAGVALPGLPDVVLGVSGSSAAGPDLSRGDDDRQSRGQDS